MIRIVPRIGWKDGRYLVLAVSRQAHLEWLAFANRCPDAAQKAFERLSNNPLGYARGKQFPLRGSLLRPFWELEIAPRERIWYAVDEAGLITIVAARDDILAPAAISGMLEARQVAYEAAVALFRGAVQGEVEAPLRVPDWAFQRK